MGLFSSTNPCKKAGNTCSLDTDCCDGTEVCDNGSCVSHTADPIQYEDGTSCVKTCNVPVPKDAKPYCYANDAEHPNEIQFCAYEKDGFLIAAEGCCDKICPSEECPPSVAAPAPPQKDRPVGVPYKPRPKKDSPEPLPMLVKILLLILAILLVAAAIFLSVG
jgi:hypothetical protein